MIKRRTVSISEQFNCSFCKKDKIDFTAYTDKFLHVEIELAERIMDPIEILMSPEDSYKLYKILEKIHGGNNFGKRK